MEDNRLDYQRLVRASRQLPKSSVLPEIRVALLSDAATQQFVPLLRVLFFENGRNAQLYEGAFDAVELEVIDPASGLYQFKPDVIIIAECIQALRSRYFQHGGAGFVETSERRALGIWKAIQQNTNAQIIQCNYPLPYERQFGNFDLLVPDSLYSTVLRLNARMSGQASENGTIAICNVEALAAWVGRQHWFDDRLWNVAKTFCDVQILPRVAQRFMEMSVGF